MHVSLALILLVMAFMLIRTAWVSDDAYITFRTIDNFVNGYGLVWNVGDRLQTYTNPLWMLLLSIPYYFSHEIYFTSICISILLTLFTVYLLLKRTTTNNIAQFITATLLLSSQAFIDFSTSGLENVLTNFFIILFVITTFSFKQISPLRRHFLLTLIAAFCAVNRLDTILLFLPALIVSLYRTISWRSLLATLLGSTPLLTWLTFAYIYYGDLLPNTYYAKLYTGIPLSQLVFQGLLYVVDSLHNDPITLLTVIFSVVMSLLYWKTANTKLSFTLCLGGLLYILYVIKNGGDFMSGRFFTAPFVLALASAQPQLHRTLSTIFSDTKNTFASGTITGALMIFLATSLYQFSQPVSTEPAIPASGITSERDFHFLSTGLINQVRSDITPPHPWAIYGDAQRKVAENTVGKRHVVVFNNVGFLGYFAGPKVYIIDPPGLTDSYLAKQPIDLSKEWRVGHYVREVPTSYIVSKEKL